MEKKGEGLSDQEFLYAYAHEYLADDLKGTDATRFQTLTTDADNAAIPDRLNQAFGKFQLAFQSYYLTEDQRVRLHEIVEDSEVRKTREIEKIAEVSRWEAFGDFRRRIGILLIVAAIVFAIIYFFTPPEMPSFDALNALSYEALAMEEDPEGRLDLPSQDQAEITAFFAGNKTVDFKVSVFKTVPKGWQPDGATVLVYDATKVAAEQFSNKTLNEKMFNFTFKGKLNDLIGTEQGNFEGFTYQAYQSEFLNIIAWQQESDTICLLVGHRSASELASIAKNSR